MQVRSITAAETVPVRWPILRAGLPRESAVFPGDEAPATRHLGAWQEERLVGVVTIYPAPLPERAEATGAWQLRGMAVLPELQRSGVGVALVRACLDQVREEGGALLWCNARVPAAEFYRRQGFEIIGAEFEIPTAGPHFRMWRET